MWGSNYVKCLKWWWLLFQFLKWKLTGLERPRWTARSRGRIQGSSVSPTTCCPGAWHSFMQKEIRWMAWCWCGNQLVSIKDTKNLMKLCSDTFTSGINQVLKSCWMMMTMKIMVMISSKPLAHFKNFCLDISLRNRHPLPPYALYKHHLIYFHPPIPAARVFSPCYRGGSWSTESLNCLPKVTQTVSRGSGQEPNPGPGTCKALTFHHQGSCPPRQTGFTP